jgi:transcriptional regulator with XRE-family HTH domain
MQSERFPTDSLIALAQAQYMEWDGSVREERNRALKDLYRHNLTAAGRAVRRIEIVKQTLAEQVRKKITFYGDVAEKYGNADMLSKPRLNEFRESIIRLAWVSTTALREMNERDAFAAGESRRLPVQYQYDYMQTCILDVANEGLRVLDAKGIIENGSLASEPVRNVRTYRGGKQRHDLARPDISRAQNLIRAFMDREGYRVTDLAVELKVSREAMSSAVNGGNRHGRKLLTKLANKIGIELECLTTNPDSELHVNSTLTSCVK